MAPRFPLLPLVGALFSICVNTTAYADPIVVTSGKAVVAWDDPSYFTISGDEGFTLAGLFVRVPSSPQQLCFAGCAPGTRVDFSGVFGGPQDGSLGVATAATVDGITYSTFPPNVDLTGSLVFDAPTVVLPALTARDHATLTAPFMFHGHVAGFARSEPDSALFEIDLIGSGTAEVHFVTSGMLYAQPEVVYAFAPASPVPEPASALFLATGMAALGVRRYAGRYAGRMALRAPSARSCH